MENAIDALKIAFAVFILIMALTITFSSISQVKQTSDLIMDSIDKTNFYSNLNANELETANGGRKVKIDTIISNLYRIPKESFEITVIIGNRTYQFGLTGMTLEDLNNGINAFKTRYINDNSDFIETFSEITYSGEYLTAEDGSAVIVQQGIKKICITYKKI